jgi:AraC-like DNA-binding protein
MNAFLVSGVDLATPLPTGLPELADLHDRVAGVALLKLGLPDTIHRARQAVVRRLQDGTPLRSAIASDLGLSDHTFQRRLTAEDASYTKLLEDTRRELAQHHLADVRKSISEIAYLLGYADQSAFYRAFFRWFGEPPGDHRASVLGVQPAAASPRL